MRRPFAVISLIVLVAAAACGGDDAREEFVEEANANCAERQAAERELRKQPVEEALDDPDAWKRLFDEELRKQRELEPPEDMAADWRRYQELSRRSIEAYRELTRLGGIRSAAARRRESVLEGEANRAGAQSRVVARRLGLDICAKQIY